MTKLYAREHICFSDMMSGTEQTFSTQCKIFCGYFILGSVGGSVTQQKSIFSAPEILPFWHPTEDFQVHIFTYSITINNNKARKTQGIQAHKVRKTPPLPPIPPPPNAGLLQQEGSPVIKPSSIHQPSPVGQSVMLLLPWVQ